MASIPWYRQYERLCQNVAASKAAFAERCLALRTSPDAVLREIRRDLITRLVHESNWQEGVYLEFGRTRELVDAVFDQLPLVQGPHIDYDAITEIHRQHVARMKKEGATTDEVAAFNLSRAHTALEWVAAELSTRQSATLVRALEGFRTHFARLGPASRPPGVAKAYGLIAAMKQSGDPAYGPLTANITTAGELLKSLDMVPFEHLLYPMRVSYLHFLHRLTMMGILPASRLGSLRAIQVHVGDLDVMFPSPSALPGLMDEYCQSFPTILPTTVKYEPILAAARASHRFVRIHPYVDGNGRVSRLVMNLVLWGHFPPVYLKADRQGRHRYAQAIKRANRGNHEPMACLIASSLLEVYDKLDTALGRH